MKKICVLLAAVLCLCLFTGCGDKTSSFPTTDLSSVSVDQIVIGESIHFVDLSKYTKSGALLGNEKYKFEELIMDTKDDIVTYLFCDIKDHPEVTLSIHGETNITTIDDVQLFLGPSYQDIVYDSADKTHIRTYFDKTKQFKVSFIYYYTSDMTLDRVIKSVVLEKDTSLHN